MLVRLLPVVAAGALMVGVASANTLDLACSFPSGPVTGELNGGDPLVCPQFNLGFPNVLQAVTITISGSISGVITLVNLSGSAGTGTGTTTSVFSVSSIAGDPFGTGGGQNGFTNPGTISPSYTFSTLVGPSSQVTSPQLNSSTLTMTAGPESIGGTLTVPGLYACASPCSGTFNILLSSSTNITSDLSQFSGNGLAGGTTSHTASATVEFTYTAGVPEPATMSLIGLGLIGFAAFRFRSKQRS